MGKVIIVTGASSGIGRETAAKLYLEGNIVYGVSRSARDSEMPEGVKMLVGDIRDETSLKRIVDLIIEKEKRIDVLFNNAGYGLYGPIENVPIEAARDQFEVNLFGLARLTQLVLPYMREKRSGTIINTSSMGGKMYTPLGAWYHATKHGLEGWSDCLRFELKQFGINVVVIEPGVIATGWGAIAGDNMSKYSNNTDYELFANAAASATTDLYKNPGRLTSPSRVAEVVSTIINSRRPKTRYVVGKYARVLIFVRKYLGDRIFDKLLDTQMKRFS